MICIPEELSIEDCVKHGIDSVFELIIAGSFCGDLVGYISLELKKNDPRVDGKSDKIARSLYWVLTNGSNPPIESFFWVDIYNSFNSHHEYVIINDNYNRKSLILKVINNYMSYILS